MHKLLKKIAWPRIASSEVRVLLCERRESFDARL